MSVQMRTRLVLWPGLGADERLVLPVTSRIAGAAALPLPEHRPGESFASYARRTVEEQLEHGVSILGGFSFGGMVVLEALRDPQIRARVAGAVLISSCDGRDAIQPDFRRKARFARWIPKFLVTRGARYAQMRRFEQTEPISHEQRAVLRQMAEQFEFRELVWGATQCAEWDFEGSRRAYPDLPLLALHGANDGIIPPVGDHLELLPEAGHLISWTHYDEVAQRIRTFANQIAPYENN